MRNYYSRISASAFGEADLSCTIVDGRAGMETAQIVEMVENTERSHVEAKAVVGTREERLRRNSQSDGLA